MKPHYPVVHRDSRQLSAVVIALCAGFLIGMVVTLAVVALIAQRFP